MNRQARQERQVKTEKSSVRMDEHKWEEQFKRSLPELEKLADEALSEIQAGKAEPLDPDLL